MSETIDNVPEHGSPNPPVPDPIPPESQETALPDHPAAAPPVPLLRSVDARDRWPEHGSLVAIRTPSGMRWFRVLQVGRKRLLSALSAADERGLEAELQERRDAEAKDRMLHLLWFCTFMQLDAADAARIGRYVRFWRIVFEHVELTMGYRAQSWLSRASQVVRGVQPGGWVWRRRASRLAR